MGFSIVVNCAHQNRLIWKNAVISTHNTLTHQGYIKLFNKTQVSDLMPIGPLVFILTTNADPGVTPSFVACHLGIHSFPK